MLDEIKLELEERFEKIKRKKLHRNTSARTKNVHVTELTPPCSRQSWYYRKLDEPEIRKYDCVSGTADDILEYKGEICIVDKKTYSSKRNWNPKEPEPSYVWQVNIYKLLMRICEGVEAKYGAIFYMDTATRLAKPIVFVFELKSIEEIKDYVIDKLDKLKMLVPPDKTVTWKCKYCPWREEPCDVTEAEIGEATRKK